MKQLVKMALILCISFFSFVRPVQAEDFSVPAKHAIAVDVPSGKILYEQDAQTPAPVGSITTLLTVYLVYEAIEEGKLSLNSVVDIGDYPYSLTGTVVSNVSLEARSYTVKELLEAALIASANSATIALAEEVAGSEPAFVDKMKAKLTEWGITDAKLVNATGLNNSFLGEERYLGSSENDENQLSAMDVAIVARRLLVDFPQVLDITSQYDFNFHGTFYSSTNQMLKAGTYARSGVDGLKTGASETGGVSFVASFREKKMQIVTVVLNANDGQEYPDNRFLATNQLIDYVKNNFTLTPLVEKGKPYQSSSIAVFNGQKEKVEAVAADDLYAYIRKGATAPVSAKYNEKISSLDAPVQQGHSLGNLKLVDKDLIGKGYLESQPSVEMVVAENISEASWPLSWWNHFVRYVNENL
jgi:D-alanyl-D-alanine carboxypeptidase (penicillin-binding protein 5/6)